MLDFPLPLINDDKAVALRLLLVGQFHPEALTSPRIPSKAAVPSEDNSERMHESLCHLKKNCRVALIGA